MKRVEPITTLFVDIGGVLLTNGWDRSIRKRAPTRFELELAELEQRHGLTFDTYEEGKITLEAKAWAFSAWSWTRRATRLTLA